MTCPNCGAQNLAEAAFCTKCGTTLSQQPPTVPPQQAPTQVPGAPVPPYTPASPYSSSPTPATRSQFQFDLRRLTVFDKVIAIASLVVLISIWLPWYGISFGGTNYTISGESAHGYLILPLLTAIILIGYLALRAGGIAMQLPIAHAPLLIIGTGVQLLIVIIGFFNAEGTNQQIGAYLGLLAAIVACGVIAVPAIQSMQQRS